MEHEKVKIKMEPGNDVEMRVDVVERIQKRFELEKKLMESKKENENVNRIIKTEGGENMNYNENDDGMLFEKTKATKMEKDVEALNQKTEMDSKTIEEMRSKLLESVIREQKLVIESNIELRRKESENVRQYLEIEQLRNRMLACEEGKELGESGFGRKESEPDQAKASEWLKTEETVKKLMESKKESENVNRIIKTGEGKIMNYNENDDEMPFEETKVTKMEKDIEALKQKAEMDSKTIEEMRSKLSESEIREQKQIRESNIELRRKESENIQLVEDLRRKDLEIEQLRLRILACEERKERGESGFGRKESEPDQVITRELSKTEEAVKNELAIMWNNLVGAPDGSKSKGLEATYNNDDETKKRKQIMRDCCHVHRRLSLQRK